MSEFNNLPVIVSSSMDQVNAVMSATASSAYLSGVQLGAGFNAGLLSTKSAIVSTAASIANAAATAINTALQVRSPSLKGRYSGRMLGLGVGGGMEDEMSYIESVAEDMALKAIPDFDKIDVTRALSLPHFETTQTTQAAIGGRSVDGLEGLSRKLDQLIKKNSNVYIQGEKAGELLSDVTDRTSGRESIFNERWT